MVFGEAGAVAGATTRTPDALPAEWRAVAQYLRVVGDAEGSARGLEFAAQMLECALAAQTDTFLTISEAAALVGRHPDTVGAAVRGSEIPNYGRRGAPRVRTGDVTRRFPPRRVAAVPRGTYDPGADARALLASRRGGHK
jgi:hypothetical protein